MVHQVSSSSMALWFLGLALTLPGHGQLRPQDAAGCESKVTLWRGKTWVKAIAARVLFKMLNNW